MMPKNGNRLVLLLIVSLTLMSQAVHADFEDSFLHFVFGEPNPIYTPDLGGWYHRRLARQRRQRPRPQVYTPYDGYERYHLTMCTPGYSKGEPTKTVLETCDRVKKHVKNQGALMDTVRILKLFKLEKYESVSKAAQDLTLMMALLEIQLRESGFPFLSQSNTESLTALLKQLEERIRQVAGPEVARQVSASIFIVASVQDAVLTAELLSGGSKAALNPDSLDPRIPSLLAEARTHTRLFPLRYVSPYVGTRIPGDELFQLDQCTRHLFHGTLEQQGATCERLKSYAISRNMLVDVNAVLGEFGLLKAADVVTAANDLALMMAFMEFSFQKNPRQIFFVTAAVYLREAFKKFQTSTSAVISSDQAEHVFSRLFSLFLQQDVLVSQAILSGKGAATTAPYLGENFLELLIKANQYIHTLPEEAEVGVCASTAMGTGTTEGTSTN